MPASERCRLDGFYHTMIARRWRVLHKIHKNRLSSAPSLRYLSPAQKSNASLELNAPSAVEICHVRHTRRMLSCWLLLTARNIPDHNHTHNTLSKSLPSSNNSILPLLRSPVQIHSGSKHSCPGIHGHNYTVMTITTCLFVTVVWKSCRWYWIYSFTLRIAYDDMTRKKLFNLIVWAQVIKNSDEHNSFFFLNQHFHLALTIELHCYNLNAEWLRLAYCISLVHLWCFDKY